MLQCTRRDLLTLVGSAIALPMFGVRALAAQGQAALDTRVKTFLRERAGTWRDLNVPDSDGQLLHDLIVEHRYTRALEIGTSTGHSGIWIAWALSKTGGKLVTVELDEGRHLEAKKNFAAAGLSTFIDARLGDAHALVPALPGPFDFVFSDADKDWYPNYFKAVFPKLDVGGCYATHNVSEAGRRGAQGSREYLTFLRTVPNAETTVDERGGRLGDHLQAGEVERRDSRRVRDAGGRLVEASVSGPLGERSLPFDFLPLHDLQVEHEDRVEHRHQHQRDDGGDREPADLRVAERLPTAARRASPAGRGRTPSRPR